MIFLISLLWLFLSEELLILRSLCFIRACVCVEDQQRVVCPAACRWSRSFVRAFLGSAPRCPGLLLSVPPFLSFIPKCHSLRSKFQYPWKLWALKVPCHFMTSHKHTHIGNIISHLSLSFCLWRTEGNTEILHSSWRAFEKSLLIKSGTPQN